MKLNPVNIATDCILTILFIQSTIELYKAGLSLNNVIAPAFLFFVLFYSIFIYEDKK